MTGLIILWVVVIALLTHGTWWQLQHRPRWLWEHPGIFLLVGHRRHAICLLPLPKGRGHRHDT